MYTNIFPSLDQGYINTLLEKYQIHLDGILYELAEFGYSPTQLLDPNCCISEIHRTLLQELLESLKDYNIHDNILSHIEDDIYSNSETNAYCSRLECNLIYEMYEDHFKECHLEDLEEIKKVFEYYDC